MKANKTNRNLKNAMTVKDLIAELELMDPDAVVLFVTNFGDYHRTQQALPIESVDEMDETEFLRETPYSDSGLAIDEMPEYEPEDFPEEEEDIDRDFVILRS